MKNKKMLLMCAILVILLAIVGLVILKLDNKEPKQNNNTIYITYYDDMIPGSKSDIKIYGNRLEIITTQFCSLAKCDELESEKETFNYSNENIDKLRKFINDNFSMTDNIEIHESTLSERQKEVIQGILLGECFFEINIEDYKYKIEYAKNDSVAYKVYFKKDNSILVKKLKINDDYDIVKIDTYSLDFSKKNKKIINDYIEKEVKKENHNIIYKNSTLKKDEISIFKSIEKNNESYLNDIENEVKLLYTISYSGLNCHTPILYLYSDNTYEYYYTFGTGNEKLIPKTGTYNYDITKIINNVDNYAENKIGQYFIQDQNENTYITYNTNMELQELLTSLDVRLDTCLVQQ